MVVCLSQESLPATRLLHSASTDSGIVTSAQDFVTSIESKT
jgi:hypothetical protein